MARTKHGALSRLNLIGGLLLGFCSNTFLVAPAAAQSIPSNPSGTCTWNWEGWSATTQYPDPPPANPGPREDYSPLWASTFSYAATNLGPQAWYSPNVPATAAPQTGLANTVSPPDNISGTLTEFWYGIGFFQYAANEAVSIPLTNADKFEGHVFAAFDSNGNQISRFPAVGSAQDYIASTNNRATEPMAERRAGAWSDTWSFTAPANGEVYVHYIMVDENVRFRIANVNACRPEADDDSETNPNPGTPTMVDVLDGDTDDGTLDPASVTIVGSAGPGADLVVAGEGTWSVDTTTGQITFTPEANFTGDPTPISYTVNDNDGNTSNEAQVTVAYGEAPVAEDDVATNDDPGTPTVINPLGNDLDADGMLDPTTVALIDPETGNPVTTLAVPGEGTWSVDPATGEITFTPEAGFTGNPTPVSYTVADTDGNTSDPATVTVIYGAPPVADDDMVMASAPGPVTINPLDGDTGDVPLDPTSVTLTGTGAPAGAVLSANGKSLTVPDEGGWSVDPTTGLVTFTPVSGFSGSPTPAAYTVADTAGRISNQAVLGVSIMASLEIIATDDGPISFDGTNGGTSDVSTLGNDTLDGNPITDPSLVTLTPVTVPTLASGGITLNPDGTITVAPGSTPGTYTLTYEICEDANPTNCATAEVELVIVDTGEGLVEEVEEDLIAILSEDLANTLNQQSVQIGTYSADALDRLRDRGGQGQCLAAVNLEAKNILFDVDKAIIKPESHRTLDKTAEILAGCPNSSFEIAGHTDSDASDAYNIDLSQRRVIAVRYALAQRGIDTSRYVARGYGERQPIASNATPEGKALNRRVEFRPLDNLDVYAGPCEGHNDFQRSFNLNADETGTQAEGAFVRDQHDCITDRREVFEGRLSYLDTEQGQTQSAINLSYRREQYRGSDSVFGYFVGLYGTKSEVARLANGEIRGVGLNGGIYGANRLDNQNLFVDYYVGGAVGRYEFDLAFDRSIGTIDTSGSYQYVAAFAGAAVSGDVQFGEMTLTPRVGFDYVYTPGADVDVVAELSGLEQTGDLELEAIAGGRAFAEVRFDHQIDDGYAN